jgi:hypothetical protein
MSPNSKTFTLHSEHRAFGEGFEILVIFFIRLRCYVSEGHFSLLEYYLSYRCEIKSDYTNIMTFSRVASKRRLHGSGGGNETELAILETLAGFFMISELNSSLFLRFKHTFA